jgi:FixJ family two-component response regulator
LYKECLQKLSDNNRLILELAAQDFSNKEIAEKMGIESYGYIRIKKMRAKKELMELIQRNSLFRELSFG